MDGKKPAPAKIIFARSRFERKSRRYADERHKDLNTLFREAVLLKRKIPVLDEKKIVVMGMKELSDFFLAEMHKEMMRETKADTELFLCSGYVASLLSLLIKNPVAYRYGVEGMLKYRLTGNAYVLQRSADSCFLMCAVFPNRGIRSSLNPEYYRDVGRKMYYRFYLMAESENRREIGYLMAKHFEAMVYVAQKTLANIGSA